MSNIKGQFNNEMVAMVTKYQMIKLDNDNDHFIFTEAGTLYIHNPVYITFFFWQTSFDHGLKAI